MKERPILFSGPMVRAILEGSKAQTRRVTSDQNAKAMFWHSGVTVPSGHYEGWVAQYDGQSILLPRKCPYGVPGDRLWVRETWKIIDHDFGMDGDKEVPWTWLIGYKDGIHEWRSILPEQRRPVAERYGTANGTFPGDGTGLVFRNGMFMPRWASRITLEITDVRVQRVQEISEEDAQSEGVHVAQRAPERLGDNICKTCWQHKHSHVGQAMVCFGGMGTSFNAHTYRGGFMYLWDSINAARGYSWDANPWCWALTFRRVA